MSKTNTDITIYAYDRNAVKYAEKFLGFKPYKDKIELFQQNYIPQGASIFDIGCGPGNNAKILFDSDTGYKISGVDLSGEMITIATQNVPDGHFWIQDIRDITADIKYDSIIASFCIVHLTDNETHVLINKISQMLNKNGSLYLSFMEGKNAGFEKTSFSNDVIFFNYYDRNVIKQMLSGNSIETVEIFSEGYQEKDGSITDDIFIFAKKIR